MASANRHSEPHIVLSIMVIEISISGRYVLSVSWKNGVNLVNKHIPAVKYNIYARKETNDIKNMTTWDSDELGMLKESQMTGHQNMCPVI